MDENCMLPQNQPRWEREEQVLLVVEYYLNRENQHLLDKSSLFISKVLRHRGEVLKLNITEKYRNVYGVQLQMENLKHFDADYEGELSGHESSWMSKIVNEYNANPLAMTIEAYEVIKKYAVDI